MQIGSVAISATAPQKMARIAAGILALAAHRPAGQHDDERTAAARCAAPLLAARGRISRSATRRSCSIRCWSNRRDRRRGSRICSNCSHAAPDILGNIIPILAGFKIATTERLPLPLVAVIPGAAALAAYLWFARRTLDDRLLCAVRRLFPAAVSRERRVSRHAVLSLFHSVVRGAVGCVGGRQPASLARARAETAYRRIARDRRRDRRRSRLAAGDLVSEAATGHAVARDDRLPEAQRHPRRVRGVLDGLQAHVPRAGGNHHRADRRHRSISRATPNTCARSRARAGR